jgi:hypothetical protein
MFVYVNRSGRMGYAFTDVRALADDACAVIDVRRPASAPHSGRPVRRDP